MLMYDITFVQCPCNSLLYLTLYMHLLNNNNSRAIAGKPREAV